VSLPEVMRVARLHAPGDVRVETAPVPRPHAGEVLIRVDACGLCGSDALDWYVARKAPVVLGHEPVGTIVATGAGVDPRLEGIRVFAHHHAPCMQCAECRRRLWSNCATWRRNQLEPGGFAEYTRVGADTVAHDLLLLPEHLTDDEATFVEPTACCLRSLDKARLVAGETVFVIGLGAMGLLIGQLARLRTSAAVFGTDLYPERRAAARAFDITPLEPGETAPLLDATRGRGADVVIVTPGGAAALAAGIEAAAPGGRVVCFTPMDPAEPLALEQSRLYFREIELLQSYSCGPDETRLALDLLTARTIRVQPLVTHRAGLDGVAAALERAHAADGLKTVILPHTDG
jgi:L-iditol 2-dehydrogenase